MKRSLKEVGFLTITAICFPLMGSGAEPPNGATLRYEFAPNTTNVYRLRIESQGELGREAIEGVYLIGTKNTTGNVATLTFKGQLRQKPIPDQPIVMGIHGPGFGTTLSAYAMRPQMEAMEMTLDDQGRVFRESGDMPLPVPLGQIMQSLFSPLPPGASNAWDVETDVSITDAPTVQGPAQVFPNSGYGGEMGIGYYPGRSGLGILSALLKTQLRMGDAAKEALTLRKTVALNTYMLTGVEPRVSATGAGDIVFDRKAGLPKSVELRCRTSVTTENVSRRTGYTLRWEMLEGAERESALNPPPPQPNPSETEMASTNISDLTEKLKSGESYTRENAARQLAYAKITSLPPDLMTLMGRLIDDPSESIGNSALIFVANHATEEHAMLLIKSLNRGDQNTRTAVVRALGKLKDKRAAEPLANVLAAGPMEQLQYNGSGRNSEVVDALARIGPAAEPAVLSLLKERYNVTRWYACGILKSIGTDKSLGPLKELILSPSKELSQAASEAFRAIEARRQK